MHQNVKQQKHFHLRKAKNELSQSELRHSHVPEAMHDVINNKYLHLRKAIHWLPWQ